MEVLLTWRSNRSKEDDDILGRFEKRNLSVAHARIRQPGPSVCVKVGSLNAAAV